jgi:hypothetical protein
MNRKRLLTCFTGLLVFSLVAAACGGGGGSGGGGGGGGGSGSTTTWVGKLAETDSYIAIMKTGLEHLVFITNGKDLGLWFKGTIGVAGAGVFYLQDSELHAINARPQGSNYTGLITVAPGRHVQFNATQAKGEAGLYRAKDGANQSGWIVLEDGSLRGAKVGDDGKFIEGLATRGGVKWTDAAAVP